MSTGTAVTVLLGPWPELAGAARAIRDEVFVGEQGVPVELEHDAMDTLCLHVVAHDAAGSGIGTGRLLPDGHIGRLAVRRAWRGQGVGREMLATLIAAARARGDREVVLNAQVGALAFYQRAGFVACGERFIEAGIEHQAMRLSLAA